MAKQGGGEEFGGGAPTTRAVQEFGAQVEKSKQSPYMLLNPTFITVPGDPQGRTLQSKLATKAANSSKFPIRGFPSDPYDSTWSLKDDISRDVVNAQGVVVHESMVSAKRPLPFTEQDVGYLKAKRDAEENLSYLAWQANKFDLSDPATRDWFEKRCPSYFDQRESLIEQQIDLAARYAKVRLRGAKTEDDLKLEYFIETDRITLPKGPIWDPYSWLSVEADVEANDAVNVQQAKIQNYNKNAYRKGLFNPTKVTIPQTGANIQNPYNKGDISGYPGSSYTGLSNVPVSTSQSYGYAYGPWHNERGLLAVREEFNRGNRAQATLATNNARIEMAARGPAAFNPANLGVYAGMPQRYGPANLNQGYVAPP